MNVPRAVPTQTHCCRLDSDDGVSLPLQRATLQATASAGLARSSLTLLFRNTRPGPLTATCLVPLPADGAISGLSLRVGDQHLPGEVLPRAAAHQRYEAAIAQGSTASLLDQERDDLFTTRIGNIPPGAEVEVSIRTDHPLLWLDEGGWEYRFPTVVPPRYLGQPHASDAERLIPLYVAQTDLLGSFALTVGDAPGPDGAVESPSHAASIRRRGETTEVRSASGFALDRDVVVRWQVAGREPGLTLARARRARAELAGRAFGLLAITPPRAPQAYLPRDVSLLLDTSGSMDGPSLQRAVELAALVVQDLGPEDRLSLLAFSNGTERWHEGPMLALPGAKEDALAWLRSRKASGGTEMGTGLRAALQPLRDDALTQVVLLSDGQISFEREVWSELREHLPRRCRVHAVGVGAAPNRSLTSLLARAGRGRELFIGHAEDPALVSLRLLRALRAPLVTDVEVGGSAVRAVLPGRAPDLFAGDPALLSLELAPEGGELWVRGTTRAGPWEQRLQVPATEPVTGPEGVVACFGRRQIDELERSTPTLSECDAEVERLSVLFQIASRRASWEVHTPKSTVRPNASSTVVRVHHARPAGVPLQAVVVSRPLLPMKRVTPRPPPDFRGLSPLSRVSQPVLERDLKVSPERPRKQHRQRAALQDNVPPNERVVSGVRIATSNPAELEIEFELEDFGLEWRRPSSVQFELSDGTERTAAVIESRTTGSARLGRGAKVRLVLQAQADTPVWAIRVPGRPHPLRIELEA